MVRLDVVGGQQIGDEVAVLLGDPTRQISTRQLFALAFELGGHDEVETVRPAADVVVDPRQLLVQQFRGERGRTEDTEPSGIGHCGDDVTAMTEREKREIDTELLADGWLHATSITK